MRHQYNMMQTMLNPCTMKKKKKKWERVRQRSPFRRCSRRCSWRYLKWALKIHSLSTFWIFWDSYNDFWNEHPVWLTAVMLTACFSKGHNVHTMYTECLYSLLGCCMRQWPSRYRPYLCTQGARGSAHVSMSMARRKQQWEYKSTPSGLTKQFIRLVDVNLHCLRI